MNRIASGIYLYNHQEYRTTIDVLISAAREHNATAQLYVALSYLELGDIAQANTFLTLTCSNRVKDPDIEKYCNSDEFVDKIDLRKKPASITFKGGCQADLPCSFSR